MPLHSGEIVLGILGGGQLGRMSAMAAAELGISVIIYAPEGNCPASHVATDTIVAAYDDETALKDFVEKTTVISYEFENIPVKTIEYIESLKPKCVFPEKSLLNVSQDRIKEKTFLNENDIQTTRWAAISDTNDINNVSSLWKSDKFILKTARFGYDGKGQIKCESESIDNNAELDAFLAANKDNDIIMEDHVSFKSEISIIIARDINSKTALYGPMLNEHKNHILHKTTVPCDVSGKVKEQAFTVAQKIADSINLVGVLTVEYFVCEDDTVLVNEIAPRTHNSGHWTIDACSVSQFDNHVRTVCGLPVGNSERHSNAEMLNLIGKDVNDVDQYLNQPFTNVHLYGKTQVKDGRKMGHVTKISPKTDS